MTAQTPAENAAAEAAGRRGNASTLSEVDQSTRDALYRPPLRDREPTEYELAILRGLQRQPHVYQGTVERHGWCPQCLAYLPVHGRHRDDCPARQPEETADA